jgi:hypothetical protein
MRLASLTVKALDAKISYSILFGDGCTFAARGVEVVFEPIDSVATSNPSRNTSSSDTGNLSDRNPPNYAASGQAVRADSEAVEFIVHWIEIVIASLQANVHDISVVIKGRYKTGNHGAPSTFNGILLKIVEVAYSGNQSGKEASTTRTSKTIHSKSYQSVKSSLHLGERKVRVSPPSVWKLMSNFNLYL